MFGKKNISKLPRNSEKSADFKIEHDRCTLIIECKTALDNGKALSIMSPTDVAETWGRLYSACVQCSSSIKLLKSTNHSKTIIAIILLADNINTETLPFQCYATQTNIFRDLEIQHIEFMSWLTFQNALSLTSVSMFIDTLIERMNKEDITIEEISQLDLKQAEPSHNYEYLKERKAELKLDR